MSKAGYRLRVADSFVCLCLITVFVPSIEARQPRAAADRRCSSVPERHKTVSTERAQHTEIPFPRDKERLRFVSTRAKFARQHGINFARQSNEHCLKRQPRAIDTRLKIPLNVTPPPPRSSKWTYSQQFPHKSCVCVPGFPHPSQMPSSR
jgi:hypothetical protein